MSYSLEEECGTCIKNQMNGGKCSDKHVIEQSINTIHGFPADTVHLGYGSIELKCQGHEEKEKG